MSKDQGKSVAASRLDRDGALVVSNRCEPSIPKSVRDELLDHGIVGVADFGTGASLKQEDVDANVQKGQLGSIEKFSRVGGYILSHTNGLDRVIVGRAQPGRLQIERAQHEDGSTTVLKCIRLDGYAELRDGEFEGIHELADMSGRNRMTFTALSDDDQDQKEQIVSAVTTLEREGRLTYR